MSQYDKLGEMLNEALNTGKIPKAEKKFSSEEKKACEKENSAEQEKSTEEKIQNEGKKSASPVNKDYSKYASLFKLFNLNEKASKEELKSAYHLLLKKYHPDNIPPFPEMQKTAGNKTRELVEAYNLLINLIG